MKKTLHILVFFCCSFSMNLAAQGILDVTENTRYEFNNYYKEIPADKTYFQKGIEITYFSFKDDSQPGRKSLNTKAFDLCKSYVENEAKYLGIIRQANSRVAVLNEINNSKNNRYERIQIQNPELKSVSCDVISILGNQVFYEIGFSFGATDVEARNDDKYTFEVKEYYLGHLQTGILKAWKPTITAPNSQKIKGLVAKQFTETYLTETHKLKGKDIAAMDYDDEGEEIPAPVGDPKSVDVFQKINLMQADYYPYYSGIIIQFQEYSQGSTLYNGKFFRMFFPYEQALKIAAFIPEFSFMLTKPKITSNVKNWTDENFANTKVWLFTQEPLIINLVKANKEKPLVKTLKQSNYQISDDKSKRFMSKMITEFNANQDPLSTIYYDEKDKITSSAFYDYDAKNRLKQASSKGYGDEESFATYEYSAENNLKTKTVIDQSGMDVTSYFYNNTFIYAYSHTIFETKNSNYISQYEINDHSFCMDKTCYLMDRNREVTGIVSPQTSNYQMQIARDSQGRVVECHREDDRYNYYNVYDDQNRFARFSTYEYTRLQQKVEFIYNSDGKLPVMKTKSMTSYSNVTNTEEDYEWVLFD